MTVLTGPTLGVIVGGIVTSSLGGFTKKKAKTIYAFVGLLAILTALPIPYFSYQNSGRTAFWVTAVLFWLILFFGGSLLPQVLGLMIDSVPK